MGLLPTMLSRGSSLPLLMLWLLSAPFLLHHYPCSAIPVIGQTSSTSLHKISGDHRAAVTTLSVHRSISGEESGHLARKLGGHAPAEKSPSGGSSAGNAGVISVLDFGAKGDGSTDDSKAFASAWTAACSSASASSLLVPDGQSYLLPPVTFSGPCKSDVAVVIKGTIVASPKRTDWNGKDIKRWITFDHIQNLRVGGGGIFNGNGPIWWKNSCKVDNTQKCTDAPTAVTFSSCNNLDVKDVKFMDSQQMHVTFTQCSNVRVSNLFISAPGSSPNTDGIHVSGTTNIHIQDSVIQTGDDCISIVSGSRYVNVTNVRCGPGHGISIGSLGENGAQAAVSDILVDTAQLEGTTNGVRIKTWQGGKGYAKGITFKNIVMKGVKNPIIIDQNYCDSAKKCVGVQASAVAISGIIYKNITGTSTTSVAIEFDCSKSVPCRDIVLQDIDLAFVGGTSATGICNNVQFSNAGVVPSSCS